MRFTCLMLLFALTPTLWGNTIHVNTNVQGGNGDGTSWADAYPELTQAISAAGYGDTIWVAKGIYYPTPGNNRLFSFVVKDGVRMFGGFNGTETVLSQRDWELNETVLSGDIGIPGDSTDNSYTVVLCTAADSTTVIDGFTITGGNADNPSGQSTSNGKSGGGMYLTGISPDKDTRLQILNCTFWANHADFFGGGAYCRSTSIGGATPFFKNCVFHENTGREGGGLFRSGGSFFQDLEIVDCKFSENESSFSAGGLGFNISLGNRNNLILRTQFTNNISNDIGGGVSIEVSTFENNAISFMECLFDGNATVGGEGGAISIFNFSPSTLIHISKSMFSRNSSTNGGCISIIDVKLNIDNSIFQRNISSIAGGVMNSSGGDAELSNCIISKNSADFSTFNVAGSKLKFANCSVYGNENESGNWVFGQLNSFSTDSIEIENTILWGEGSMDNDIQLTVDSDDNPVGISHTLVNAPDCASIATPGTNITCGPGMFYNLDPMFLDTAAGDYRLHPCSPARNAGSNAAVDSLGLLTDIAGLPRIQEGTVDMGAHESPAYSVALDSTIAVACGGTATGGFTASVTGGCPPFTVDFGGFSTVAGTTPFSFVQLPAGPYNVTVTDSRGDSTALAFTIPSAPPLGLGLAATAVDCTNGTPGTATATATGGTGPLAFLWENGDTLATAANLPVGTVALTVTDSLGCTLTDSVEIGQTGQMPLALQATDVTCSGFADGTATALPGGLAPHLFSWGNMAADSLLENLPPGSYPVTVTDALGCTATSGVDISQPDTLTLAIAGAGTLCHGASDGTLAALPQGGTPGYLFGWGNGETDSLLTNLPAGTYPLTLTDANGCTATATAVLGEAGAITVDATVAHATSASASDGGISLTATLGGTPPYSYLWSTGGTTASLTNLPTGTYQLTVTDADSCQQVFDFFVDVETAVLEPLGSGLLVGLSPNPVAAGGTCRLHVESARPQRLRLRLLDLQGRTLWTERLDVPAGNSAHPVHLPQAAGTYFLETKNEEGEGKALRVVVF